MAAADELAQAAHAILSRAERPGHQPARSSRDAHRGRSDDGDSSNSLSSRAAAASSSRARAGGTPPPGAPDSPVQPGCMPPLDEEEAAEVAAAAGVSLDALPPLVAAARGHVYSVGDMVALTPAQQELVLKVRSQPGCMRVPWLPEWRAMRTHACTAHAA